MASPAGGPACHQSRSQAVGRERVLDLGPHACRRLTSGRKICIDLWLVSQVVADHRIRMIQTDGRILLDNFLRSGAVVKCRDQCVESDSCAADAIHAAGVCGDRHRF